MDYRHKWLVFAAVGAGVFSWVIDTAASNIALPSISAHFSASLPTVQWVLLVYLLTITTLLLPMGRASDVLGRNRMYLAGFLIYAAGALLVASAQSMPWLLAARGIQAVGSASVQVNGLAIALRAFPSDERGKVLGANVMAVSFGAIVGPVLGGELVDVFGWRSVFVTTAILSLVAMAGVALVIKRGLVPAVREGSREALDLAGMITIAIATITSMLVLSRGHQLGWSSPFILSMGAVATVALVGFFVAEKRAVNPMVALSLLTSGRFALGALARTCAFIAVTGNIFVLTFYLQGILELSAAKTGLLMIPFAVVLGVVAPIAGRLSDRFGPKVPGILGPLIVAAGLLTLARLDVDSNLVHVVVGTMVMGAGMGMFTPSNMNSIVGTVDRSRYGMVTGFTELMRNIGQVTGVAIPTLVLTMAITSIGAEPDLGVLRTEGAAAHPLLSQGFVDGMRLSYKVQAGIAVLACALSAAVAIRGMPTPGVARS